MSLLSFECRHRYPGGFTIDLGFEATQPVTSLFGPSGSGKTTALSMIAGLKRADQAKITIGGRTVVDTAAKKHVPTEKRHIGFVFQDHLLFPHLNVETNLKYGQRRRRAGGPAIAFERVVEVLELGDLLQRYPKNLSGGQRQRVSLGRALLSRPELLLMDEPLASLDHALKARILTYLDRVIGEWHIPTLFVSHGQADVRRLADWVVIVENGRMVTEGKPDEALGQPDPLGWKNSVGPMNLLRVEELTPCDGHWVARVGGQTLNLASLEVEPAPPVFVQFAPADVTLSRQDVAGVSVRNQLRGQVRQLVNVPDGVFVAVDVGQILWSEVTREAADELALAPGVDVTCLIKTYRIDVL